MQSAICCTQSVPPSSEWDTNYCPPTPIIRSSVRGVWNVSRDAWKAGPAIIANGRRLKEKRRGIFSSYSICPAQHQMSKLKLQFNKYTHTHTIKWKCMLCVDLKLVIWKFKKRARSLESFSLCCFLLFFFFSTATEFQTGLLAVTLCLTSLFVIRAGPTMNSQYSPNHFNKQKKKRKKRKKEKHGTFAFCDTVQKERRDVTPSRKRNTLNTSIQSWTELSTATDWDGCSAMIMQLASDLASCSTRKQPWSS